MADALKGLVLDGRLPLDARLPGERRLAEALGVSRITVTAAMDRLRSDGFLASRVGSGTYTALPLGGACPPDGFSVLPEPGTINLSAAVMPAGAFVHAAYARALESLPPHLPGHGYDPVGVLPLRRAAAETYEAAGLRTGPKEIVVTTGAQNALAILLRTFGRPGDGVVMDHPTYPHAIEAIVRAGLRPIPVALTATGWDIDGLVETIARVRPRLIYLIGAHQNPTGHVISAEEEAAVSRAAARNGALLILDDTQRELWFTSPPPALTCPGDPVVRLGSMSKTWWGGLRIGWIRAEPKIAEAVVRARASLDLGAAVIEQLAATHLLTGDQTPVSDRRAILGAREAALHGGLSQFLPDWQARWPSGGLSLWVALPRPVAGALATEAHKRGLILAPGTRFGVNGAFQRFLRLPFCLPETELAAAIDVLALAWDDLNSRPGRRAKAPDTEVF